MPARGIVISSILEQRRPVCRRRIGSTSKSDTRLLNHPVAGGPSLPSWFLCLWPFPFSFLKSEACNFAFPWTIARWNDENKKNRHQQRRRGGSGSRTSFDRPGSFWRYVFITEPWFWNESSALSCLIGASFQTDSETIHSISRNRNNPSNNHFF